jgi:hypothetical protein
MQVESQIIHAELQIQSYYELASKICKLKVNIVGESLQCLT